VAEDLFPPAFRRTEAGEATSMVMEPYLSSSIALEIAMAIHEGFSEIHLYGVDLNTDAEYAWQKPGVEYMLGVAVGRGIKIVLPDNCPLLAGTIYGRGYLSPQGEQMSYDQLEQRFKSLQKQSTGAQIELARLQGAHAELTQMIEQMVPGLDHELMEQRLKLIDKNVQQIAMQGQNITGALKETLHWMHQTPAGQQPKEAMSQLVEESSSGGGLATEGPTTLFDSFMSLEPGMQETNGFHEAEAQSEVMSGIQN
jgi:hypothetical protein